MQNASIDAYKNILFYVFSRAKYGEIEFVGASKGLEGPSEGNLRQSKATSRASCRKTNVSSEKLKRAQKRFERESPFSDSGKTFSSI